MEHQHLGKVGDVLDVQKPTTGDTPWYGTVRINGEKRGKSPNQRWLEQQRCHDDKRV